MTRTVSFPGELPRVGIAHRLAARWRSFIDSRTPMVNTGVELYPSQEFRPLAVEDLPLIVVSHNERRLIQPFLAHYRKLGVTRFLWVDDASTDGSREDLGNEPDVDLHTSNVRFKISHRGRLWRQMLVQRYGANRWYLSVDTDEFLVFCGSGTGGLRELIPRLEKAGLTRIATPMIDMYPAGDVGQAIYDEGRPPWEVANLFDASGYTMTLTSRAWRLGGGVRTRLFGSDLQLMKFPLIFWSDTTNLIKSIHAPAGYWDNFERPLGALLHFKFFGDYQEKFRATVENGQHYLDGAFYGDILKQIDPQKSLVMEGPVSAKYIGPEDLCERGFFGTL